MEDLAHSVIMRLASVILGQPFPWNVPPPAKEKSLQWYAHITPQKHKDDLKRPESGETDAVYMCLSCVCNCVSDVYVSVAGSSFFQHFYD